MALARRRRPLPPDASAAVTREKHPDTHTPLAIFALRLPARSIPARSARRPLRSGDLHILLRRRLRPNMGSLRRPVYICMPVISLRLTLTAHPNKCEQARRPHPALDPPKASSAASPIR